MKRDARGREIRLHSIALIGIRGFREVEIADRPVTLIIGRNGTNKTTLLRSVALGLTVMEQDRAALSALLGPSLLRTGEERGFIRLTGIDGLRITIIPERPDAPPHHFGTPVALLPEHVFGYGAVRGVVGGDNAPLGAFASVRSLFDYRHELLDPELTLRRLKDFVGDSKYEGALRGFKRVLGLTDDDSFDLPKGGGIDVIGPSVGGRLSLNAWADGYRLTLSWLIDVFGRATQSNALDDDGNVEGVVLVDEIEQHLHPSMQLTMIANLREALPAAQLIVTTHSPLVAMGVEPAGLVVLRRTDGEVVVEPDVPDFRGYSAEDVLTDERLFDTPAHAPEDATHLARYHELVAKGPDRRTSDEESELRELARTQPGKRLLDDPAFAEALVELARRIESDSGPKAGIPTYQLGGARCGRNG